MRVLVSLLVLVIAGPVAGAEQAWRLLQAQHYTVLSQLDDRETLAWARDYDQFIASITTTLRINPKALPPLTVILFERDKDFERYKVMRPDGRAASISGQFLRRPSWSMIAMSNDGERENTRNTIRHEATHWLMSVDPGRQPAWFAEGVAEMFATFERKIEIVKWGLPIPEHLYTLNQGALIPFDEFLTQRSALYDSDSRTGRFYAQSWAFVHMLLLSNDPVRRAKLLEYLHAYRNDTAENAVKQVFGDDLSIWQKALSSYIGQRSFGYMQQPLMATPALPAPADASPAYVEAALGQLALGSGKMDLARSHAQRGMTLDARQPKVHELMAYIAQEDEDSAALARHSQEAVQLGSKDAQMFLILGDSYAGGPNSELKDASRSRINAYETAINLNPRNYPAYERLMMALAEVESPTDEDVKFLNLGRLAFPDDDWLKVGVALLAAQRGQQTEARVMLDSTLREGSSLDGSQRNYAMDRRRAWSMRSLSQSIPEAMRKGDTEAARHLIEAEQSRLADDAEAGQMLSTLLSSINYSDELEQARKQISSGRKADARSALDRLLAKPDLPPELRQYATRLRTEL
ncbi:MAG: hypothetical protein RL030_661 [Pseudomonadota bacterium]